MSFLDVEEAVVTHLQGRINEAQAPARVFTAAQLAHIEERAQITPAIYVLFDGYTPTQEVGQGRVQQIEQTWSIVIAVRNAYGAETGAGVRREASFYLDLALSALCGFKAAPEFSGMALADGPGPNFAEGYGYFPLTFKTRVVVRATT